MTTTDPVLAAYQRSRAVSSAYLLVGCPRCKSWRGLDCMTSTGFVGGASGPHAARRKLVAGMSEAEILADWDRLRAEREASRADTVAMFERLRAEREGQR